MTCPACGRENDATSRFCAGCGASLATAGVASEARKIVTVFFTDVAESTALGERLDPELLRRVMWRYFDVVQGILERHGGTVEKFVGDAVLAIFGVPVVHEDDALRAVRAAAEIRDTLEGLNDKLGREHGIRIATRTGRLGAMDTAKLRARDRDASSRRSCAPASTRPRRGMSVGRSRRGARWAVRLSLVCWHFAQHGQRISCMCVANVRSVDAYLHAIGGVYRSTVCGELPDDPDLQWWVVRRAGREAGI